uniref:DUF4440 domain-containing protein n=1 Tax=Plectus sambesii TaxID=2011161 RepID=A0A914VBT9_9BILA
MEGSIESLTDTIASLTEASNECDPTRVVAFYSEEALMYDERGGQVVVGKSDIEQYWAITLELAIARGRPLMERNNLQFIMDGDYVLCRGTYVWPRMHNGQYLHKWQYQSDGWRLVAHYFAIETILADSPLPTENLEEE